MRGLDGSEPSGLSAHAGNPRWVERKHPIAGLIPKREQMSVEATRVAILVGAFVVLDTCLGKFSTGAGARHPVDTDPEELNPFFVTESWRPAIRRDRGRTFTNGGGGGPTDGAAWAEPAARVQAGGDR